MKNDKKLQAKDLYFQTGLTKTQIAEILGISRRSLHYWIRQESWERLKTASEHLPAIMAENCYHLLGHVTRNYLQDYKAHNIGREQIDNLYKLTLTIHKLKNRSTVNESMEMFGLFQDGLKKENPRLAKELMPYIEKYLSSRSAITRLDVMPAYFTETGHMPPPEIDQEEVNKDFKDYYDWEMEAAGYSTDTSGAIPLDAPDTETPSQPDGKGSGNN